MNTGETKYKPTGFWIALFGTILLLSVTALLLLVFFGRNPGCIANVYHDGELIRSINLSGITKPYTFTVMGTGKNTVRVEPGRICVESATCPDQICVHRGWISDDAMPIVCMPNKLVIQIEDDTGDIDASLR